MGMHLRIGTRGSRLALAQSEWVKEQIQLRHPDLRVSLVKIKTKGDKILDSPLSKIGGKGLFVKEIEAALLRGEVDLAVHSMKDVPADLPEGLDISIFPEREDPRDVLVSPNCRTLSDLPEGASVGTGSLRRAAQILHLRPDLRIVSIRGNVETRLKKLREQNLGALVLAAAGLRRLGLKENIMEYLDPEKILPAIGQGALGLELRREDTRVREQVEFLNHRETELCVRTERAFLKTLGGGCQVPIAGYARYENGKIELSGMVAELDGSGIIRDRLDGNGSDPEKIGITLAKRLLASGAERILAELIPDE